MWCGADCADRRTAANQQAGRLILHGFVHETRRDGLNQARPRDIDKHVRRPYIEASSSRPSLWMRRCPKHGLS